MQSRSYSAAILSILLTFIAALALAERPVVRIGTIPVLQSLPLFVAETKSLFDKHGIKVEIVMFNTATEKDIALTSGSIDGYFGDLLTPVVLEGNGKNVKIVAVNYDTRKDRRMFGILTKPGSKHKKITELAGVPIAISSNSVVHYVAEHLLIDAGVAHNKFEFIESKNIGLRFQMLLSGQIEAAVLPEPLVTAAIAKGATLLANDSGLAASSTVFAFRNDFILKNSTAVKSFLSAMNESAKIITDAPDSVRSIMVEQVRLPEQLRLTYPVPKFAPVAIPEKDDIETILAWLKKRQIIRDSVTYEMVVDGNHLP